MESNQIVIDVFDALTKAGVPLMLVGSYSANFYGRARATKDADFVMQIDQQSILDIEKSLGPGYQFDPQMSFETVTGTMRYILKHRDSTFKVELFLLSNDSHDQTRFKRRRPVKLLDRMIDLPTPEDVIVTKLRWSKLGNRQKDIDDVRGVLSIQFDQLDLEYIREWCEKLRTRDIFESLVKDIIENR